MAGDMFGRMSSARQTREARTASIEDAERARRVAKEDKFAKESVRREREALDLILDSLLESGSLIQTSEDEARRNARRLGSLIYRRAVDVADGSLRERLEDASSMLDLVQSTGRFGSYNPNGVIFVVRRELVSSIGDILRSNPIPGDLDEFRALLRILPEAKLEQAKRRHSLGRSPEPSLAKRIPSRPPPAT